MPLAYIVAISGSIFNWGAIISKQLSTRIEEAQNPKNGETPAFFMTSSLLDAICARNVFPGLSLSCNVSEFPFHVYFNIP